MTITSSAPTSTRPNVAMDQERTRLIQLSTSISRSAHEMALTADLFSGRLRMSPPGGTDIETVEAHLGQVRRNCAESQFLAESVMDLLNHPNFNWHIAQGVDETLRDAQVRLTLADFAYDRACDTAA